MCMQCSANFVILGNSCLLPGGPNGNSVNLFVKICQFFCRKNDNSMEMYANFVSLETIHVNFSVGLTGLLSTFLIYANFVNLKTIHVHFSVRLTRLLATFLRDFAKFSAEKLICVCNVLQIL
jgi:hypothetical protein